MQGWPMEQSKARLTRYRQMVGDALRKMRRDRKLRQLDLAELINVDHTLVSRMETGRAAVEPGLMAAIRAALKPSEAEWKWLQTCVARCALETAGTTEVVAIQHQDLIDISAASLQAAIQLRAMGNSVQAASATYPVARAVSDALATSTTESVRRILATELCELLFHEAKCYLDYLPPLGVSRIARPVASRLFATAELFSTARGNLLSGVIKEGLLYFGRHYEQADEIARDIFEPALQSEWRPEVVRAVAINAGHLGDEVAIHRHEKEIRRIIAAGISPLDQVFMLDGLARGYARQGKPRAVDIIEEAWEVPLESSVQSTLRYVQKVRAHLEVNDLLGRTHDSFLVEQAREGLAIAQSMGYERYVQDLTRLTD
jgi:transcriptional regulator with XRE-family HTH domain